MTIGDAANRVLGTATYDTAIPEPWLDRVSELLRIPYRDVRPFVWAYDEHAGYTGRPCALTEEANAILRRLNTDHGCCYPLTANPVDPNEEE